MTMKEKILEAFSNLGFKLTKNDDWGYAFDYERLKLLYMPNDNDDEFLSIAVPGICDCEEDNVPLVTSLTEKINSTLKYIKANILAKSVWLFYERELISDDEDMMLVISHMIDRLEAAHSFSMRTIEEIVKSMGDDSADESDAEEVIDGETSDDDEN